MMGLRNKRQRYSDSMKNPYSGTLTESKVIDDFHGIPVEVITPRQERVQKALDMRKQRKPIHEITFELNRMIEEENRTREEVGFVKQPLLDDSDVRAVFAYVDSKNKGE